MITRQQLEIINRKTLKYPLHIAEKDYLLTLVLQGITQSSLGKRLVFKGGTAVHHCYLQQHRFSEDLDFSANQTPVALEDVHQIFTTFDFLKIKKEYRSDATVKIEKLQYVGPLAQPNSLKVEIDFFAKCDSASPSPPISECLGCRVYRFSHGHQRNLCRKNQGYE